MNGEDNWQPENDGVKQDHVNSQEKKVHEEGQDEYGQDVGTHPVDGPTPLQANTTVNSPPIEEMPKTRSSPKVEKDTELHGDDKNEVEPPEEKEEDDDDGGGDDDDDDDDDEGQDDDFASGEDNVLTSSQVHLEKKCSQEDTTEDVNEDEEHRERTSLVKEEENAQEHVDENDQTRVSEKPNLEDIPHTKTSKYICTIITVLVVFVAVWYSRSQPPPERKELSRLDVFLQELDRVRFSFPNQHRELWRRSKIHIQRHLNKTDPSEPVSIIFASGQGAERTLGCLAGKIASAFSAAFNASVLDIDGVEKASEDSDQVKMDIDRALKDAFEEEGRNAAVVHRFEQLPPASTLIFYRYCDHENAAYKNVFLAFTVMLEKEPEFPADISLGAVEEMVQEFIKEKFVSPKRTPTFNQMDVDKLSGLWSRISHLILPVAAEETIEQQGCGEEDGKRLEKDVKS